MQQCKNCGRTLTEAANALGYCPSCGTHTTPSDQAVPAVSPPAVATMAPPITAEAAKPVAPLLPAPVPPAPAGVAPRPAVPPPLATITQTSQPRSNSGIIAAIIVVLLLMSATGGTLAYVGQQGQGPLAAYFGKTTGMPLAAVPTATIVPQPTLSPTATPVPTVTPLPTVPPPPVGYTSFTSPSKLYGCNYPSAWTINDIPGKDVASSGFISADQAEFFQVSETTTLIMPADVTQYITNFVKNDSGSTFQLTVPAKSFTSGSNTWTQARGTYIANGVNYTVVGSTVNHGTHGYIVIYSAQVAAFKTVAGSTFAQMIASFTFLS